MSKRYLLGMLAVIVAAGLLILHGRKTAPLEPTNPAGSSAASVRSASQVPANIDVEEAPAADSTTTILSDDIWDRHWHRLMNEPRTTARDEDAITFLEELAATDPRRAISLAEHQTDPEMRSAFLQAALRGWGEVAGEAAITWAQSQTNIDSGEALSAIFHGAARDPEKALSLANRLSEQSPERAGDYGSYLIAGLNRTGEFSQAATFAAAGPPAYRIDWMNTAYSQWAKSQPTAVMEFLNQVSDPDTKRRGFEAAISRWAQDDPGRASAYALSLSNSDDRDFALTAALRLWSAREPAEAAAWINRFEPSRGLDYGSAILACQPAILQQPKIATSWAENIVDPQLRVRVLATIVNEWSTTDPVAARQYVETSVRPNDRPGVLSAFDADFSPISLLP